MAGPTPVRDVQWDGRLGLARWYAAWTAGLPDNLTDAVVVDVSALTPVPDGNAVKIRRIDLKLNGVLQVTFEHDNVRSGTVNTTTLNTRATWVSGDKFDTAWKTAHFDTITINAVSYAITTVDSTTQITLGSDPGDQTGVAFSQDGTVDRFSGQTSKTNLISRRYDDGSSNGFLPYKASTAFIGDVMLTTSGAIDGSELNAEVVFEGT